MINSSNKHILIRGCFNINNTGDSHHVPIMVDALRTKHPNLYISVQCVDNDTTVYFTNRYKNDRMVNFFALNSKDKLSLIRKYDYMTFGPGGLLAGMNLYRLVRLIVGRMIFKITGTDMVIVSAGVSEPIIQSKIKFFLFKTFLRLHKYACFRHDIPKLERFVRLHSNIHFGSDLLNIEGALPVVPYSKKKRTVVVCLANVVFKKSPESVINSFVEKMCKLLYTIVEKNYDVILCAFDKSDYPLNTKIATASNNDRIRTVPFEKDHSIVAKLFAEAEYSICARYHSIVFSINYRTPCIALSYDNKCDFAMDQFGLSKYNLRFSTAEDKHYTDTYELDLKKIIELFDNLESEKEKVLNIIEKRIPIIREKAALNLETLNAFISEKSGV